MTRTRTSTRTRKTATTAPAIIRFPNDVLGYLQIALEGPLGPGGTAHRIKRYPVTTLDDRGHRRHDELIGAACHPAATRLGPNHDTDPDDTEEIPTVVCRSHSAAFAQAHGATRCTNDACWPIQPDETTPGGSR